MGPASMRFPLPSTNKVGDSLKTSGNEQIVTGVSCIACHRQGMIEAPFVTQAEPELELQCYHPILAVDPLSICK